MKKIYKNFGLIAILMLSIIVVSCGSDDGPGAKIVQPRTADDVREDFSNLVINEGVNDLEIESLVNNVFWNFRIIKPTSANNTNKRPLIIRLHGGANSFVEDAHKSTSCLVEPGLASLDAIIVSPNSNGDLWYEEPNIVQVLALVELVATNLPVDLGKIVVMGYSDGGNGSFFFSQYYSSLFSAAIPMATSYATTSQGGVTHQFDIPLYVIHGENDDLFPIGITEGYVNDAINAGSDIQFVTANGLNHFQACDYVSYLEDAAAWLQTEVWN